MLTIPVADLTEIDDFIQNVIPGFLKQLLLTK